MRLNLPRRYIRGQLLGPLALAWAVLTGRATLYYARACFNAWAWAHLWRAGVPESLCSALVKRRYLW